MEVLSQPETPNTLATRLVDSQPSLNPDQARTGTFGVPQEKTIQEGYQLNAFETPEEDNVEASFGV